MLRRVAGVLAILVWTVPAWGQTPVTVEYYHLDGVGSVRAVTNGSGAVVRRHDYFPFGEGDGTTTGADTRRFTAKERDAETGLDYFGARYYGSRTGRFRTVDPVLDIEQALVDAQRWNRYAYVRNNPFRYVDPDGRAIEVAVDVVFIVKDIRAIAQQGFTTGNSISLAGDVVGAVVPFATGVGAAARRGYELAMAGRWLEEAAQWATGLGRNTDRILEGLARGANFRVPDLLSDAARFIGEVKNAAQLNLSKQLGDLIQYSRDTNKELGLFVGENTRFSKPLLEQLQRANARIYRFVDRKWKDVTDELYGTLKQ